jgi:hypothetical protein
LNEAKVVAVARAQHQPMISERDGASIAVDRRMPHIKDGQMGVFRNLTWPGRLCGARFMDGE